MVKAKKPKLSLTDLLLNQLDDGGLSLLAKREYRFSPFGSTWRHFKTKEGKARWSFEQTSEPRRWRFDLAFPSLGMVVGGVAVEIQGGTFIGGAHSRGAAQTGDNLKLVYAQLEGWTVLWVDSPMIRSGVAADLIRRAISWRSANT